MELKKVHDAATKVQSECDVSVHENVPQYEEDWFVLKPNVFMHHVRILLMLLGMPHTGILG